MNRIVYVFTLLLLVGSLSGCSFFAESNNNTSTLPQKSSTTSTVPMEKSMNKEELGPTYNDATFNFTMKYPRGWYMQRQNNNNGVEVTFAKDGIPQRIIVRCLNVGNNYSLQQIVASSEKNANVLQRQNANLGNMQAIAGLLEVGSNKIYRVTGMKNGIVYSISYTSPKDSFEQNSAIAMEAIASFRNSN